MGVETVLAVFVTCVIMLLGCIHFAHTVIPQAIWAYAFYLLAVTAYLVYLTVGLRLYRYREQVALL